MPAAPFKGCNAENAGRCRGMRQRVLKSRRLSPSGHRRLESKYAVGNDSLSRSNRARSTLRICNWHYLDAGCNLNRRMTAAMSSSGSKCDQRVAFPVVPVPALNRSGHCPDVIFATEQRRPKRRRGRFEGRDTDNACIVAAMRYRYVAMQEENVASSAVETPHEPTKYKDKDEQSPTGRQNGSYLALAMHCPI